MSATRFRMTNGLLALVLLALLALIAMVASDVRGGPLDPANGLWLAPVDEVATYVLKKR